MSTTYDIAAGAPVDEHRCVKCSVTVISIDYWTLSQPGTPFSFACIISTKLRVARYKETLLHVLYCTPFWHKQLY